MRISPSSPAASLDPGIRRLVIALRKCGFDTTDSGDGVTKRAAGDVDALRYPHVFVAVDPGEMVAEADRLNVVVTRLGVIVQEQGAGAWFIQASYDPSSRTAILALCGPEA